MSVVGNGNESVSPLLKEFDELETRIFESQEDILKFRTDFFNFQNSNSISSLSPNVRQFFEIDNNKIEEYETKGAEFFKSKDNHSSVSKISNNSFEIDWDLLTFESLQSKLQIKLVFPVKSTEDLLLQPTLNNVEKETSSKQNPSTINGEIQEKSIFYRCINEEIEENQMFRDYGEKILKPMSAFASKLFKNSKVEEIQSFVNKARVVLAKSEQPALNVSNLFENFFDIAHFNKVEALIGFQKLISMFEKALFDLVVDKMQKIGKTKRELDFFMLKPPKLSEFLKSNDILKELIGEEKRLFLRCFVGPLNSLNIRNILFHGFCTSQEFSVEYYSLLWIVMVSFEQFFKKEPQLDENTQECTENKLNTHFIPFPLTKNYLKLDKKLISENNLMKTFKNCLFSAAKDGQKSCFDLLERSSFVIFPQLDLWKKGFEYFFNYEFTDFMLTIFPLIEHSTRRLWVISNLKKAKNDGNSFIYQTLKNRLFTAEINSIYTTMDVILSAKPSSHLEGQDNAIFSEMTLLTLNLLCDTFIWPSNFESPRDLISHGMLKTQKLEFRDFGTFFEGLSKKQIEECENTNKRMGILEKDEIFRQELSFFTFNINFFASILMILMEYDPLKVEKSPNFTKEQQPVLWEVSNYFRNKWEPLFHPLNRIRQILEKNRSRIEQFSEVLDHWNNIQLFNEINRLTVVTDPPIQIEIFESLAKDSEIRANLLISEGNLKIFNNIDESFQKYYEISTRITQDKLISSTFSEKIFRKCEILVSVEKMISKSLKSMHASLILHEQKFKKQKHYKKRDKMREQLVYNVKLFFPFILITLRAVNFLNFLEIFDAFPSESSISENSTLNPYSNRWGTMKMTVASICGSCLAQKWKKGFETCFPFLFGDKDSKYVAGCASLESEFSKMECVPSRDFALFASNCIPKIYPIPNFLVSSG